MAKGEIVKVELDNGEIVNGKASWNDAEKAPNHYFVGWNAGQAPHFSISDGRATAMAEKFPELIVGDFNGVPVLDTEAVLEKIFTEADTAMGLTISRVATSRNTANKKLGDARSAIEAMSDIPQAVKDALLAKLR